MSSDNKPVEEVNQVVGEQGSNETGGSDAPKALVEASTKKGWCCGLFKCKKKGSGDAEKSEESNTEATESGDAADPAQQPETTEAVAQPEHEVTGAHENIAAADLPTDAAVAPVENLPPAEEAAPVTLQESAPLPVVEEQAEPVIVTEMPPTDSVVTDPVPEVQEMPVHDTATDPVELPDPENLPEPVPSTEQPAEEMPIAFKEACTETDAAQAGAEVIDPAGATEGEPAVIGETETKEPEAVDKAAEAETPPDIIRHGMLWKSGRFFKNRFGERYCRLLRGGPLQYDKTDAFTNFRVITLTGSSRVVAFLAEGEGAEHPYRLEVHGSEGVFTFASDSEEDRDEWVRAIETVREHHGISSCTGCSDGQDTCNPDSCDKDVCKDKVCSPENKAEESHPGFVEKLKGKAGQMVDKVKSVISHPSEPTTAETSTAAEADSKVTEAAPKS